MILKDPFDHLSGKWVGNQGELVIITDGQAVKVSALFSIRRKLLLCAAPLPWWVSLFPAKELTALAVCIVFKVSFHSKSATQICLQPVSNAVLLLFFSVHSSLGS